MRIFTRLDTNGGIEKTFITAERPLFNVYCVEI